MIGYKSGRMTRVMLDTHVVVWLYGANIDKISIKAQQLIDDSALLISPIVLLELQYLFEIKKISCDSNEIYEYLNLRINLNIEDSSAWYKVIKNAVKLNWTRDPFDRLIVAHADLLQMNLITKDNHIISNYENTVW
jgi:PIN domain nuclease of toxin-antitoxin system